MDNVLIIDRIKEIILPILKSQNIELIDITYKREAGKMVLRLLVDKLTSTSLGEGIRLDECSDLNQKINQILYESNLFESGYIVEVSSPGLDRPLRSQRDFERAIGKLVKITTSIFISGRNSWIGWVDKIDSEKVNIRTEDGLSLEIPLDKIVKAKLEIRF